MIDFTACFFQTHWTSWILGSQVSGLMNHHHDALAIWDGWTEFPSPILALYSRALGSCHGGWLA